MRLVLVGGGDLPDFAEGRRLFPPLDGRVLLHRQARPAQGIVHPIRPVAETVAVDPDRDRPHTGIFIFQLARTPVPVHQGARLVVDRGVLKVAAGGEHAAHPGIIGVVAILAATRHAKLSSTAGSTETVGQATFSYNSIAALCFSRLFDLTRSKG